jgi:hypothetical protein
MVETHGFGIDGNCVSVAADIREVAAVEANRHDLSPKIPKSDSPRCAEGFDTAKQAIENK